jgi:hypothetical protein
MQAPESDGIHQYGEGVNSPAGVREGGFPIYHVGSGTFMEVPDGDVIHNRNHEILVARYNNPHEDAVDWCISRANDIPESDIYQHIPTLRRYASKCEHITEFGYRSGCSVYPFIAAKPKRVVSYDVVYSSNCEITKVTAQSAGVSWDYRIENTLTADIEETDLLFIDTVHTYTQCKTELLRHASKVRKYLIFHDVESYGEIGDDGVDKGIMYAIREFMQDHPEWIVEKHYKNNNGLLILKRIHNET